MMPPPDDEPIKLLKEQERETSEHFIRGVRRKIERRQTASQLATFSWRVPRIVLFEMAEIMRHLVTAIGGGGKEKDRQ